MPLYKIFRYAGLCPIQEVWSGTSLILAQEELAFLGHGYLLVQVIQGT